MIKHTRIDRMILSLNSIFLCLAVSRCFSSLGLRRYCILYGPYSFTEQRFIFQYL